MYNHGTVDIGYSDIGYSDILDIVIFLSLGIFPHLRIPIQTLFDIVI